MDGQLGLGDTNNRNIPTLLKLSNNEKISFITCGNHHTICLTKNNNCYVCGYNKFGQLGLSDRYPSLVGQGGCRNCIIPTLLNLPNNEKISFITCGCHHT